MSSPDSPTIVVGAGVIGLSAAWHLAGLGQRVLLLDSGTIAGGTTTAGAGFVGQWAAGYAWYWNESERDVEQYGIDFYRELADSGHGPTGYRQNGNVWLTVTDQGRADHIPPFEDHPLRPPGSRTLTPAEAADLVPGLDPGAVTAGFLHPDGIQISAPDAARALAASVRARGVEIREHTPVAALEARDGAVTGVRTRGGEVIDAARVVLAAGSWTNTLLAPFGRELPTVRVVASRLITRPFGLPGSLPTLMLPELQGLWIREHRAGVTYGAGPGYEALSVGGADRNTEPDRRPVRPDLLDAMREYLHPVIARLLPDAASALGADETPTQGVVSMTADRNFIVGAVPEVAGLVVAGGDNESGVTHGPGLGRIAAELSATGSTALGDATRYDPARFPAVAPSEADVIRMMPARREADARRAGATT
ncbi:FAD-dependent oxidoreductase [Curtobacterium sp. MCPF17_021]|uniref:NAD(P)/FAD-dependent oxidoreductase n=1 Tax=Curtobacterium sp. MCPF17_021 TaxID=2175639 RepID=UPI000DA901F1|nr:FAD-dependent oxidoreductase [Curtobacterium sp. MCPF17_021]WIE83704.1 FAD-dependent oxidoreductase [Curtobacterium sp. MCPF17_021]